MARRHLRDRDIEFALEEICGIPDNCDSEDDLELDENEEYNSEHLRHVLEDSPDRDEPVAEPIASVPSQRISVPVSDSIILPERDQDSEPEESSECEAEESNESEVDEDEPWNKKMWVSRPDPEVFDEKLIAPTYLLSNRCRPVAHLDKFFDDEVYQMLVTQTNLYAEQNRISNWTPVDKKEIRAFLGILVIMGYHILPQIELYWSTDPGFRVEEVASVMPIKRFKNIMRALHLNDNTQQPQPGNPDFDKLYKLRPLLNLLGNNFQTNAKNSSSQSVDESMILFNGGSTLKQYMPLKPIKRGYKVWCRCDSQSGYLYEFEIYTGKTGQGTETGLGAKVVKNLTRKLMEEEFEKHVTFDNFFTDTALLQYLHENGLFATGTVRRNRSDLPTIIKNTKNLKLAKGNFKWRTKKDVAFTVWQDTKEVLILSTAFHPKIANTHVTRTQKDGSKKLINCPRAVQQYTKRMGGGLIALIK